MRVKVSSLTGDFLDYGIGKNNIVLEFEEEEKDKDIELFMWRLTRKCNGECPNLLHLVWLAIQMGKGNSVISKVIKEE